MSLELISGVATSAITETLQAGGFECEVTEMAPTNTFIERRGVSTDLDGFKEIIEAHGNPTRTRQGKHYYVTEYEGDVRGATIVEIPNFRRDYG